MTMLDGLCDVCMRPGAIGVASTSIPYSCAFCRECAEQGADPEWIFEHLLVEVAGGDPAAISGDHLVTWKDGRYVTFREWARAQQ